MLPEQHLPEENLREIVFQVKLNAQARHRAEKIAYSLVNEAGKLVGSGKVKAGRLEDSIHLAVPNLPIGRYRLSARAVGRGGRTIGEAATTIRKLASPPSGNVVRVDENRNLLVNGEPLFLTIGWYGGLPREDRPDIAALQNVVTPVVPVLPDASEVAKNLEKDAYSIEPMEKRATCLQFQAVAPGHDEVGKDRQRGTAHGPGAQ